jgi:type IX secretion system PorP/SprF family membrane protein
MKKQLIVIVSLLLLKYGVAQDIHLSQFYTSEHLLNPAKVGDFEGDYRIIGNYRNQWRQINTDPLNTYVLSFDKAFRYYSHEIDGGILLARDEFTGFNTLTQKVLLSAGYAYILKGHKLRIGIQPGMVFKSTDLNKQTFPSQWNYNPGPDQVGFFDPSMDRQENTITASQSYFDLNMGVQWSKRIGKFEFKSGFAMNHINKPKDTFFATQIERLKSRQVFHSEVNYYLTNAITIQPKMLWMWTAKANELVFGSNVKLGTGLKAIPGVFAGAFYRHGANRNIDAIIPIAGFSYKRFDFGFSYDVNVSELSDNVKRRKTFELSVIYTGASSKPTYMALPCDRY